jgi:hypothetical protein
MTSWIKSAALALGLLAFAAGTALAGGDWEGVWQVKDTAGQAFEITLGADGSAKASLHESMVGSWKAEGDSAVISWKTGWTTKITKEDGAYKKTAYRKGAPLDGPPSNASDATKVK